MHRLKMYNFPRLVLVFLTVIIYSVNLSIHSQSNGITSVGSGMFQKHTGLPSNAFYSQHGPTYGYDPGDLNAVTIEAGNLPLTSSIINSLNRMVHTFNMVVHYLVAMLLMYI